MRRARVIAAALLVVATYATPALARGHARTHSPATLAFTDPAGDCGLVGYYRSEASSAGCLPNLDILKVVVSSTQRGPNRVLQVVMTVAGAAANGDYDLWFDVPGCSGPPPDTGGITPPTVPGPSVTDQHPASGYLLRAGPSDATLFAQSYGDCLAAGPNNGKMAGAIYTINGNVVTITLPEAGLVPPGTTLRNIYAMTSGDLGSTEADFAAPPATATFTTY